MGGLIRVGILTISDRCSRHERVDESGPAIQGRLPEAEYVVSLYAVVPDERKLIQDTLKRWCDDYGCDIVLTTGGTGLSPRDITPEATRRVIEREAPQIALFLAIAAKDAGPKAFLSRGIAGIRGNTLVVNLPGSPAAAAEGTMTLLPLLPHAVAVLRDDAPVHPA